MPPTSSDATDDPRDTGDSSAADDSRTSSAPSAPDDGRAAASSGPRIGRRRMLRTLVNAGYGVGLASAVNRGSVPDGQASITYALVHDDPGDPSRLKPRMVTVPAEWRDRLARSFELRQELAELSPKGLRALFVVPGSFDDPAPALSLTVTDATVGDELRERFGDVDVGLDVSVLDDVPPLEQSDSGSRDPITLDGTRHTDVPGGVACTTGAGSRGTLAPCLYNSETGARRLATANHLYGAGGTKRTEHGGEPLYVLTGTGTRKVAEVGRGYPDEDVVWARPVDGSRPVSEIHDGATVAGQLTRFGLALLRARGDSLEKMGAFSGYTRGTIKGIDGITCYAGEVCKTGQLKWGDESAIVDGDSGSVNYHPDPEHPDEYVLVGGFNNARTWWPGANFAWGTAAYHLLDRHGLHF